MAYQKINLGNAPDDHQGDSFRVSALKINANIDQLELDLATLIPLSQKGASGGVAPLGLDSKVPALYLPSYIHGQCRFVYVSTNECRLVPYNGNGLIINRRMYTIPAAGVALAPTGLAASTNYYVYAKDDGAGGIALEAIPTAGNPHATHIDGVEIRSGDSTKTLVGWVFCQAAGQFIQTNAVRGVASWFNRRVDTAVGNNPGGATSSTTPIGLIGNLFVLRWGGELVESYLTGYTTNTSSSSAVAYIVNSGVFAATSAQTTPIAGGNTIVSAMWKHRNSVDELMQLACQGYTSGGSIQVFIQLYVNCPQ